MSVLTSDIEMQNLELAQLVFRLALCGVSSLCIASAIICWKYVILFFMLNLY